MAWIKTISNADAEGDLKALYDDGMVDNIEIIHSLDPASHKWHVDMYKQVMYGRGSSLTRAQREMIAVTVSSINHCHY
jgi:alkylhydroperoxidase family enzyme